MRPVVLVILAKGIELVPLQSTRDSPIPFSGRRLPVTNSAAPRLLRPPRSCHRLPGSPLILKDLSFEFLSLYVVLTTVTTVYPTGTSPAVVLR
jgi:hypothetical protein